MVTILKFPVYVKIESGSVDRALVSKVSKEILFPELLDYLSSARVRSSILKILSEALRGPVDVQLLTEFDLINRYVSKEVPSTHNVE
jgi:hypothetical protein